MIDASFAVQVAALRDEATALAAARALLAERLTAPPIFWHEVASALRSMRLRGAITEAAANAALNGLAALGIGLEPATSDIRGVIAASERHQLSVYDAAYLELALRSGARLATRDKGLAAAAARAGVATVSV